MFKIPSVFADENECYITKPALQKFACEKRKEDLRTTVDRPQLIRDIEEYANRSLKNEEEVLNWLDGILCEGIKELQIRFLNENSIFFSVINEEKSLISTLNEMLVNSESKHLCGKYTPEIQLFRYDYIADNYGKSIKLFLGKLISTYDKGSGSHICPYPIVVEIYINKGIVVGRSKSKSNMYDYMKEFDLDKAHSTTAEKELKKAISFVCNALKLQTVSDSGYRFKSYLYMMLNKYTKTPREIVELMEEKEEKIHKITESIMENICHLPSNYKNDVSADVLNLVEKYFSITYQDKAVFTKNRDAYPLRLMATDEEESRVEQTAALEDPLQSKAIFFDNKKMLQKSKLCDGLVFMFDRINTKYCTRHFKVKINVKRDFCILKFTEYTMEEDIKHVLFSLVNASGDII